MGTLTLYWPAQLRALQVVSGPLVKKALEDEQRLVALSIYEMCEAGKLRKLAENVKKYGGNLLVK